MILNSTIKMKNQKNIMLHKYFTRKALLLQKYIVQKLKT